MRLIDSVTMPGSLYLAILSEGENLECGVEVDSAEYIVISNEAAESVPSLQWLQLEIRGPKFLG